ncbi:hypothetical protein AAS21_gp147 [Pantoea phage vB_PagS_AAS21]|uniref:Uncharacterized protein n=1 Tax=Pantoea phage vB_PagS_AAS21 TaxID=2575261 RepID=A0A4Y5P1R9_9CAUD|nr:hypothetical protein AAS21_gp147 [Pantoea phage vB_PagS_AAS21]
MTQAIIICVLCLIVFILAGVTFLFKVRLDVLNVNCQLILGEKDSIIKDLYDALDAKDLTIESLRAEINQRNITVAQAKDMVGQLKVAKNIKLEIMRRL